MKYGLSDNTIRIICDYFAKFPQIELVKIFGSRAKGNYENGSDIDFAVFGKVFDIINKLSLELYELETPYKFDVVSYDDITNADLKAHIDRVGQIFYKKPTNHI